MWQLAHEASPLPEVATASYRKGRPSTSSGSCNAGGACDTGSASFPNFSFFPFPARTVTFSIPLGDPIFLDIFFALVLVDLSVVPLDVFLDIPMNPNANDVPFPAGWPYLAPAN